MAKAPESISETGIAQRLHPVFHPRSVAVVGASSLLGKWCQMILTNIVAGKFPGKVFPVNSGGGTLCGLRVFKRIEEVPEPVDLAIVTIPAETMREIVAGCGEKGVKGLVVVTSGFGETGDPGRGLEEEVVSSCGEKGMLLIGPNTMGILSPHAGLFATGTHTRPRRGGVAFISQSGNMGNQLIHWAEQQGIGISLFVGSGNEGMVTCGDYLEYLEEDSRTNTVILYMESVKNGRRFLEVAKRLNRSKPVIVLKGGRTQAGKGASASHTGAMSGEIKAFRAACRQAGLLEVTVPSELLTLSAGFSSLPLPKGNRVGIVTLGGGWGVVTADECSERGLQVPEIPDAVVRTIGSYLPPFWSRRNPVDLVGTRDPEVPLVAVEELLKWDGVDAVISLGIVGRHELVQLLVRSTQEVQPEVPARQIAQLGALSSEFERHYVLRMAELMEQYRKPVIGVSLARTQDGTVRVLEGKAHAPLFYQTPEDAVSVLASMVRYRQFLSGFL